MKEDIKYIDIGANLFSGQFHNKILEEVERAEEKGVGVIITGSSFESSVGAAKVESVYSTVGIHPHDASDCSDEVLEAFEKLLLENESIVAVGECGLDYDRMYSPKDVQLKWFERQVELAVKHKKPLFLHERAAADDFYQILTNQREVCERAVVHCYTGDRETAEKYLELGCYIGVTGWVCDKRRNQELVDALEIIPVEKLMVETDSPYLIPRGIKGLKNPNRPENIVYVLAEIARIKGVPEEELRIKVLENTRNFFGI